MRVPATYVRSRSRPDGCSRRLDPGVRGGGIPGGAGDQAGERVHQRARPLRAAAAVEAQPGGDAHLPHEVSSGCWVFEFAIVGKTFLSFFLGCPARAGF